MSDRIVVISDTHLGRPRLAARSADALRPLWEGADHFIVNGDVAEVHHPTHWTVAARETLRLHDLCEDDGVQLTLLSGNHDPYITPHRYLHLAGDRVFVTHGDAVHRAIAPWSPAAGRIRAAWEEALAEIEPERRDSLGARLHVARAASHAEWGKLSREAKNSSLWRMCMRPWAFVQVIRYWRAFPQLTADFTATHAPNAAFALTGHTHRPGIWHLDGRVIINTGSYGFPGSPRAVTIEDECLLVWRIVERGGVYRMDRSPIAEYTLPAPARQPRRTPILQEPAGQALPAPSARYTRPGSSRPIAP